MLFSPLTQTYDSHKISIISPSTNKISAPATPPSQPCRSSARNEQAQHSEALGMGSNFKWLRWKISYFWKMITRSRAVFCRWYIWPSSDNDCKPPRQSDDIDRIQFRTANGSYALQLKHFPIPSGSRVNTMPHTTSRLLQAPSSHGNGPHTQRSWGQDLIEFLLTVVS